MSSGEKPWTKNIGHVLEEVKLLIENPLPRREVDPEKRWPETEREREVGATYLQDLRELACRKTGMSMEQLLEAERDLRHDYSPILVQENRELSRARTKRAKVPERYTQCVVDRQPIECEALGYVRAFLSSKKNFLMLAGGKGVYKSGSASWALGQIDGGAFVHAYDLVQISIEDKEQWKRITNAPVVVLDDLGREKRDGSLSVFIDAFQKLFNGAYSDCRRLIMTGNISRGEFNREPEHGGYGTREYDRLKEAGDWYGIAGESARGSAELAAHWTEREREG